MIYLKTKLFFALCMDHHLCNQPLTSIFTVSRMFCPLAEFTCYRLYVWLDKSWMRRFSIKQFLLLEKECNPLEVYYGLEHLMCIQILYSCPTCSNMLLLDIRKISQISKLYQSRDSLHLRLFYYTKSSLLFLCVAIHIFMNGWGVLQEFLCTEVCPPKQKRVASLTLR